MKKITLLLTLVLLASMVLAACAVPAAPVPAEPPAEAEAPDEAMHAALEDGTITIAWIPKALNNPVFEIGEVGAKAKAAELTEAGPYKVVVDYMGSVASDMTEQAAVMADAVTKGVDAIGVSCNDPDGCIDPINDAVDLGIEVMTWDSDSPDSERFTYLGVDNYEGGLAAGEMLVNVMGEEGQVALLTGVPGAFNLEERIRGFKDYVADYPGIEIVATAVSNDDINLGVQVVEETMQAYPDLDGWFFVGLWPLFADRGSMPLWDEAAQGGEMKTIVFDTLPLELDYLKDGYVQGLVGQKYWGWGYDTVQMIYDKIVEGVEYDGFTNSGMDLVDECNVDVMAEMWEKQDFTIELPPLCSEGEAAVPEGEMHAALEDGTIVIAWIPKALNNPVFEIGEVGARTKAAELTDAGPYKVVVDYMGSVASDMTEQAAIMADAVTKGVDAIGVSCNDPDGCIDPINDAVDLGIEVMTWDSDSPDSERFTYLGVDNYEGGLAAGEMLVNVMGEEGQVALLTGVPGAFNLEERIRGFKDYVADYPGIEIVATAVSNDDINLGVQVVEETMQAYPDLDGWFFVGLWPLFADRGSMPLWDEAAQGGEMKTIVFDTLPLELDYLKDGYVQGLVGQKYWGWGYDTVQMIYDKIVEGVEYDGFTNSGMDLVDECNVDVMAEMWEKQDFTIELPPLCQ
ncbi:MAG: sugar-binding protein [Chloroflexota bacterium]|nr:sugar-binding protein [Chloroflexota bacterium]